MVRLIAAFACALVANADYICTTSTNWRNSDCQCLAMVQEIIGFPTVWSLPPRASNAKFQSHFAITHGGISYQYPDGQELCVTYTNRFEMAPCDDEGYGGVFGFDHRRLLHMGKSRENKTDECLEPYVDLEHTEVISVGECSPQWRWTMSSTPTCSYEREMVIS